jgi:hypothetical protein
MRETVCPAGAARTSGARDAGGCGLGGGSTGRGQRPGGIAFLRTAVHLAVDEDGRQRFLRNRRLQLDVMLGRAADRGEPAPALGVLTDRVLAPLYFRVLFGISGTDPAYARGLVDGVLTETR